VADAGAAVFAAESTGAAALEEFRQTCVDYLVCVLAWFEERDRRLAHFAPHRPLDPPLRAALEEALGRPGRSRDALEKLETALAAGSGPAWREFAQYFHGVWSARRDALDALLGASARIADWRALAGVDADTILEERARYARVRAAVPAGVRLASEPGEVHPG
jgi:hypothetical protein